MMVLSLWSHKCVHILILKNRFLYLFLKLRQPNRPAKLRSWGSDGMVVENGMSIYKSAKLHGVPYTIV